MRTESERGFALVAAVAGVAACAYISFQVLASDQGAIAIADARVEQARLTAAADAGIFIALHGLGADDRAARWPIDGRTRQVKFNGVDLAVTVEDERGKAPLAGLNGNQARVLFSGAGVSGERLDALVSEFVGIGRMEETNSGPRRRPRVRYSNATGPCGRSGNSRPCRT